MTKPQQLVDVAALSEVLERFQTIDSAVFREIGVHLTCSEARRFSELLHAVGLVDEGTLLFEGHFDTDDPEARARHELEEIDRDLDERFRQVLNGPSDG